MTFGLQEGGGVVMFGQGKQLRSVRLVANETDYEIIKLFTNRIFC